jgi:hypothetical protein
LGTQALHGSNPQNRCIYYVLPTGRLTDLASSEPAAYKLNIGTSQHFFNGIKAIRYFASQYCDERWLVGDPAAKRRKPRPLIA